MKILVSGGAGFIGSNIVDAYITKGYKVVIIDNLSTGNKSFINKKAVFYNTDIRNFNHLKDILQKEKPDIINHHAAQISVRDSLQDPQNDADVNILGLINLLEASRIIKLKKFIFASSGGVVYGDAKKIPTTEDYEPKLPMSPYGISKLASEYYLNVYRNNYKIPFIALRYSNVYGPRQNPHGEAGVVAIFSLKLIKKLSPTINGDGTQTRDYIFIDDVVKANIMVIKTQLSGIFNIGTGIETDVNTIFNILLKKNKSNIKAINGPAKKGEQKRSCLDTKFAHKKMGWEAKIKLEDGLAKTINYFRTYASK